MKKLWTVVLGMCLGLSTVLAQTHVTGTVTDGETGGVLPGVSILVQGTTTGVVTDAAGKYSIQVPDGATLEFTFIGMAKQVVAVGNQTEINVTMQPEASALEEVMIVAYGPTKKSTFTGSATQVSGAKLAAKNPSEVTKSLQGEVAGVDVYTTNGQPGTGATIRIRGLGSVNSSNAPLYVVDGVPYGADLSGINPSDIESTTVLKDATAAALYGSRAANGVVLITTKKGASGKTRVEAEIKYGVNTRLIPLYETIKSPERFTELTWEGLKNKYQYRADTPMDAANAADAASADLFNFDNGGIYEGYNIWDVAGTDLIDPSTGKIISTAHRKFTPENWEDYIFRSGQKMEGNVRLSGGAGRTTYFTSLGYLKDEGYYIGSDFQRFTGRANINTDLTPWLKHNMNFSYAHMNQNRPGQTDNMNNGFQFVNFMAPLFPVFQRDDKGNKIPDERIGGYLYDYGLDIGNGRPYASGINPAGAIKLDKLEHITDIFVGNTSFEARFLKDFKFTVNLGVQYLGQTRDDLTNPFYGDAAGLGRIEKLTIKSFDITSTQKLSYGKSFNRHNLDIFAAHEVSISKASYTQGQKSMLVRGDNTEWDNAVIMSYMYSDDYGYNIESYFGQIRYDYDEKYFFDASLRSDGSSRFSKNHRWGTFGSVGAGWMLTKENFLNSTDWLKELKLKASVGFLGNQDLYMSDNVYAFYPYLDLYNISNLNDLPSFSFRYKGNPALTWERSRQINVGVEFNIDEKLEGEFDYFIKTSSDMLFYKQVAPSLGYSQYPVNDGKLQTNGIEFSLTGHVVNTNDWKVDIRLNGGSYQNKMIAMPIDETTGKPKPLEQATYWGWSEGHSTQEFYMREYAGVDPKTGVALYRQYFNKKADGTREAIANMVDYQSKNTIETLESETTDDYSDATQKYVGKTSIPTISGGFGLDVEYKGVYLNSTFTYALGGYAVDEIYATLMGDNTPGEYNWHKDIEARWQKPGDVTDVPILTSGSDSYANMAGSDRFLTKRSYLNLANVQIGYKFPKSIMKKLKLEALTIYASGDNLFLLSARKGFASMSAVDGTSNRSRYLPLSTIMGGIKVEF